MNEEIKKKIELLEDVVLALHRSAGQLDNMLQEIKRETTIENAEYLYMFIKTQYNYRKTCKHVQGYDELDEMELDIWKMLIADASENVKNEEES